MSEEQEKLVFIAATHAEKDPERASFPLLLAVAAQTMDMEAVVVLQSDGVFLAKKGFADNISVPGFTPLKQLMDSYVANGGEFLT